MVCVVIVNQEWQNSKIVKQANFVKVKVEHIVIPLKDFVNFVKMKVEHIIIPLKDFFSCFKCLVFCSKWANSRGYVFYYISSPGLQIVDILEATDMKLLTKGRMFLPRVPVKKSKILRH